MLQLENSKKPNKRRHTHPCGSQSDTIARLLQLPAVWPPCKCHRSSTKSAELCRKTDFQRSSTISCTSLPFSGPCTDCQSSTESCTSWTYWLLNHCIVMALHTSEISFLFTNKLVPCNHAIRIYCVFVNSDSNYSFSVGAPQLWNELPVMLQNETNLSSSKSKLKTFYSVQAFP